MRKLKSIILDKKSFYKEKGVKDKSEEKKRGKEWGKELIFKESRLSLQLTLNSSHILFCKKQNKKSEDSKKIHDYLY